MQEDVFPIDLIIEQVKAKIRFRLRLEVKLSLESPNVIRCFKAHHQSPLLISFKSVPEVRGLPSIPFPGLHRYYAPLRLPPGPAPKALLRFATTVSGTGLPRYPNYLPDMLSSLPRWIRIGAFDGCFPILQRPSPNIGRVGFHDCPFEACSRFTRVTACQVAAT
jgi:hypothetical protein